MDILDISSGKKFGDKRIILFSDLGSPFVDDQVEAITEGLKSLGIQLTVM